MHASCALVGSRGWWAWCDDFEVRGVFVVVGVERRDELSGQPGIGVLGWGSRGLS